MQFLMCMFQLIKIILTISNTKFICKLKKDTKSSVLCRIIDIAMIFLRSVELSAQEPNAVLHVMLRTL